MISSCVSIYVEVNGKVDRSLRVAKQTELERINEIARKAGLERKDIEPYGEYIAKIKPATWQKLEEKPKGHLILVTGITPTRYGEGKTCTTIGLTQAMGQLGETAVCTLRQPSMGPVFGIKGGATGGGHSQVLPMETINLGLTGDINACANAHNLLAAMVDNHLLKSNTLRLTPESIRWNRVIDMNDRPLRNIRIGLGGNVNGIPRTTSFDIAAASEIMAILGLADDLWDLRGRLRRIIIGINKDGRFVTAGELEAAGAMTAILRDAIKPNLIQTMEGQPCLMHTGPYANIAHGTNSIIAIRYALRMADYVFTEAGFGSDLGGEKFFDIVCRQGNLEVNATVIVASARALKMHGGAYNRISRDRQKEENVEAVQKGCANLAKHIENMKKFGPPVIVAINRFPFDTDAEIAVIKDEAIKAGADATAVSTVFQKGGKGGKELANAIIKSCKTRNEMNFLYREEDSIKEKIETIAREMYGAGSVRYTENAGALIEKFEAAGFDDLQICMAKTQKSLSATPSKKGRPEGFELNVNDIRISAGAGFLYPIAGRILTMPGLPSDPAAKNIDVTKEGEIVGLS